MDIVGRGQKKVYGLGGSLGSHGQFIERDAQGVLLLLSLEGRKQSKLGVV